MIVYSLPTCGQCRVLKAKLKEKNIDFTVVEDIETMKELGIQGVPVLQFDDGSKLFQMEAIKWATVQEAK
jgi:glutaredoxin